MKPGPKDWLGHSTRESGALKRMHKPERDPATKEVLPPEKQDKRSVIPIELGDVDQWLAGTVEEAQELLKLTPVDVFDAGPITAPA